jgi:inhibitor of KinA
VTIISAGDAAVVLEFDERIDPAISTRAAALAAAVASERFPGVRDVVPTYRSVTVYFDPLRTDQQKLTTTLHRLARVADARELPRTPPVAIPVCYGGDCGPDLATVAAFSGLSEAAVIDLHAAATYRVLMLGFTPGFAYMGIVDARIAASRLETPRQRVPRGSVGIAREQTGIYPSDTPGGWQLIGRTPLRTFDLSRADPFLLHAGDQVQFVPIARRKFDELAAAR